MKKEEKKAKSITETEEKEEVIEPEVKITKDEIDAVNEKLQEAEDKAKRAQAELINYRKRKDEEVQKMLKYKDESIILELLPVIDNFERALQTDTSDKNLLDGIKMIYQGLIGVLNKFGVKEIEALNKPFDPNYHHAVMIENEETKDKDIVIEVLQKGYILKDKVLRPAMVKVNK